MNVTFKSVLLLVATLAADPPVKAAFTNVTPRLVMLSTAACAVAVPVRAMVAVVALVPVTTAVKPAGTLATV